MLYCCGCYFKEERQLQLYDNVAYKDRVLYFGKCPKCGALKTYVKQRRITDGKYSERKPKNSKEVARFIKRYEKEAYYEIPNLKVKNGTAGNMGWNYIDASKSLWVKDFNNVRQFKVNKEYQVVS